MRTLSIGRRLDEGAAGGFMGGSRSCVWKGYVPDCLLGCVNSLWADKVGQPLRVPAIKLRILTIRAL